MKIPDGGRRANAVKPQGGDTVFLKNDTKRTAMYLERTYRKGTTEYGTCSWTVYELVDEELVGTAMEKDFLVSELTVFIDAPRKSGRK